MPAVRRLAVSVPVLALAFAFGCGGSDAQQRLDMGGADGDQISSLIEEVNEAVGNPKKLDTLFVKGSKPADPKKFAKCGYSIAGKPSLSGATGTAKVRVDPAGGGQKLGDVEWTFEKEGDKWKIKSAPLP